MDQNQTQPVNDAEEGYLEWKMWDPSKFSQFDTNDDAYFCTEFELILQASEKPRIFELGFGNGRILGWCMSKQFNYCGVEKNPELVKRARKNGVSAYESINDPELISQFGKFNCVLAIDVFEHIPQHDLPELLLNLSQFLVAGGYVIARFPNGDSPFGRVYQNGDMTHCTTIGRFKMIQVAKLAGLEVIEIRAPKSPSHGLNLIGRLKRKIGLQARILIETCCGHLYFYGQPIPFSPNYVVVLRKSTDISRSK